MANRNFNSEPEILHFELKIRSDLDRGSLNEAFVGYAHLENTLNNDPSVLIYKYKNIDVLHESNIRINEGDRVGRVHFHTDFKKQDLIEELRNRDTLCWGIIRTHLSEWASNVQIPLGFDSAARDVMKDILKLQFRQKERRDILMQDSNPEESSRICREIFDNHNKTKRLLESINNPKGFIYLLEIEELSWLFEKNREWEYLVKLDAECQEFVELLSEKDLKAYQRRVEKARIELRS